MYLASQKLNTISIASLINKHSAPSTQNSALKTQHSALSTHHSANHLED
ncbi:hypothetical protein [Nostoc sp. CMAA1605]|nr:hypothetical protein [Nostoc sp. CMAA1605]